MSTAPPPRRRRLPWTLWAGLLSILCCEQLLLIDVVSRGGQIMPAATPLPPPSGAVGTAARLVAVNMTVLCWAAYLLVLDGLLERLSRTASASISSIRRRPNRFVTAWLSSVPLWCYFDWVNFLYMGAWRYHGLPEQYWQRVGGYLLAFAAISPGMFLAAQLYQHLGLRKLRLRGLPIGRGGRLLVLLAGAGFTAYPFWARDPVANLTIWLGLMCLLDPINHQLGAPSVIGDWRAGRYGRTVSLMAAGLTCGVLWEFWNYWALAKWTYNLSFLGHLERFRLFEMPLLGFLGFLPFAVSCWVALNTFVEVLTRLRLRVAEPLPDEDSVI